MWILNRVWQNLLKFLCDVFKSEVQCKCYKGQGTTTEYLQALVFATLSGKKKKKEEKKPSQISIEMALCVVEEAFQLVHAHDTCETVVINPKHTSVFLCPCLSNYILELWNEIFNMCIHPCNFKIITLRLKLKVLMKPLILMKRLCSKHHLLKPNLSCLSTIGW